MAIEGEYYLSEIWGNNKPNIPPNNHDFLKMSI